MRRYLAVLATAGMLALPSLALAAGGSGNAPPADPPPLCPSASPNSGNPQNCGHGPGGGGAGNPEAPPLCPSASPNSGRPQNCGHGPGGAGNPSAPPLCPSASPNSGRPQNCGHPVPSAVPTGGGTSPTAPPPGPVCPEGVISEELDLSPAAFVCISVLPATDDNGTATCPAGALGPVAVPAEPVLYVCVTVGPTAAA